MELSAYPRHRKRCLNGFRASFTLVTGNGGSGAPVALQPHAFAGQMPQNGSSVLTSLANEICQEAGVRNLAPDAAFDARLALALKEHPLSNVIAIANPTRQQARRSSSEHLRVAPWGSESQLQVFDRGAYIRRNSLRQIIEVCSQNGEKIGFGYSPEGSLRIFTRFSSTGEVQAIGVKDLDQVIVKDGGGNLLFVGESMEIAENGRLTVWQSDRRFFGIDLIHALYTEGLDIEGKSGTPFSLKAIFALDGFRMSTCFQSAQDRVEPGRGPLLMRFYGRDGSLLAFESSEKLQSLEPSQAAPEGTRAVNSNFAHHVGEKTAWDSVNICALTDWTYFHQFIAEV